MKNKPTRVLDLMLLHITKLCPLSSLPECPLKGTSLVMATLKVAAENYKDKHGKMPVLFLDGADLLAKDKEDLVIRSRESFSE